MKVILAKKMGFCFGVERAVEIVNEESAKEGSLSVLGSLIHNPRFIKSLEDKGVRSLSSFDEINGDRVIIRSHGIEKTTYDKLNELGTEFVDATCPIVLKSQKIVSDLQSKGIFVVIVGDKNHSEIKSIKSFANEQNILVSDSSDDIANLKKDEIGILAQTTLPHEVFEEFCKVARENIKKVNVFDTICNATLQRQNAAKDMAKKSDAVVVVGGKNSSNTKKLALICTSIQPKTYHIESSEELQRCWFEGIETVGVTAGASTPDEHINEVIQALDEI